MLSRGEISPRTNALELRAFGAAKSGFTLGQVPVNFLGPIGVLDIDEPIRADGKNLISGWAVSAHAPVKVKVFAFGKAMLTLPATNLRDDVAKVFPAWPLAKASGFEDVLPMQKLPRGRYRLRIVIDDEKGHSREIDGPEVINDLPVGKVLAQQDKLTGAKTIALRAWLGDEDGIRSAMVETETGIPLGALMLTAANQAPKAFPDARFKDRSWKNEPPMPKGGIYTLNLSSRAIPAGLQRIQVVVQDMIGNISKLPGPLVLDGNSGAKRSCAGEKLHVFYPGGTADFKRNFLQLQQLTDMAHGGCVEVGLRSRVEYLRATHGAKNDFKFDANFPERLRNRKNQEMTGESLNTLLNTASRFHAPLMITLDGGVWADAKFSAPDLDIVDMLEQDESAVQWNQFGKTEPDDALKGLAGSTHSPQLARMMSLNYYNRRFLDYKKRNLQAAAHQIVAFIKAHPATYVAVNLDPDQYINPWFYQTQWYDYNPDTLRQYREWLFHLGPYMDGGELASSRLGSAMTLAQANRLAKQAWKDISAVEPPRQSIDYSDQWQQLWTQFRRHLVAHHYALLAKWAKDAGLPSDRIFTSQTYIQPDVAVSINDVANGWNDQAGVSIEGAKPQDGHLGAILYGPASRDQGKPRSGSSLINNIRRVDPDWGVVEFHPATIAFPEKLPSHEESYATMQTVINGGAHFLSPMWGSFAGDRDLHPYDFKAYDVMEGSSFEYELVWWLRAMQDWPVGSLYYPFGNSLVKSSDGWATLGGTTLDSDFGALNLSSKSDRIEIMSPLWEMRYLNTPLELIIKGDWIPKTQLQGEITLDNGAKLSCAFHTPVASGKEARCTVPAAAKQKITQFKLTWKFPAQLVQANVSLDSIALVATNAAP
ncbi:MAG: hypothetical protein V4805_12395 [Pseudomonadota bacterium]